MKTTTKTDTEPREIPNNNKFESGKIKTDTETIIEQNARIIDLLKTIAVTASITTIVTKRCAGNELTELDKHEIMQEIDSAVKHIKSI